MNLEQLKKQQAAVNAALELANIQAELVSLQGKASELKETIKSSCSHLEEEVREYCFPGSYYDKSSIELSHYCKLCGTLLKRYHDPNHYGSYG